MRSRTYQAFKFQNVKNLNKSFDLFGSSQSFFNRWILYQLYGDMIEENCGYVWQSDHCIPIGSVNLLDENDMKKYFTWVNVRPMYSNENNSKKAKINQHLYLHQQIKAEGFLNLNDQVGVNQDFH